LPTGACGINCDVCRLNALGLCSSCGPGKSPEAEQKMAAQFRILGGPCPILECASSRRKDYCLRDCEDFPCERFSAYPFSEGFLNMQERRRNQAVQQLDPTKEKVLVPPGYWEDLEKKDISSVCENALAQAYSSEDIVLTILGREILVDRKNHSLRRKSQGEWEPVSYPLLELLVLVYLLNAGPQVLSRELVSAQQLKTAHFFQGPHELRVDGVLRRFGRDLKGFRKAAESLGGESQNLADAAFKIPAFPKVPLYYLLWEGDDEFEPRVSVLFDRSIEHHLSADAIWGLVSLVSEALVNAPNPPF
jgi:Domain of unknown function (DUF3786)